MPHIFTKSSLIHRKKHHTDQHSPLAFTSKEICSYDLTKNTKTKVHHKFEWTITKSQIPVKHYNNCKCASSNTKADCKRGHPTTIEAEVCSPLGNTRIHEIKRNIIIDLHETKRLLEYKVLCAHETMWKEVEQQYKANEKVLDNFVSLVKPIQCDIRQQRANLLFVVESQKHRRDKLVTENSLSAGILHQSQTAVSLQVFINENEIEKKSVPRTSASSSTYQINEQLWGQFVNPKEEKLTSLRNIF